MRRPLIALLACLALACANLSGVQRFAGRASGATGYRALVDDYVASPERQKRYQPKSRHQKLDALTQARARQRGGLLALHGGLVEYMAALGRLAADRAVAYDRDFDALVRALRDAEIPQREQADAVAGLAEVLTRAASDGWRQRQLQQMVETANADVQVVVAALLTLTGQAFRQAQEVERAALESYYAGIVRSARREGADSATLALLREQEWAALERADARLAALGATEQALARIGAGHQRLYEARAELAPGPLPLSRPGLERLVATLARYADEIETLQRSVSQLRRHP